MPKRKFAKTGKTVFKRRRTNGVSKPLAPPRTGGFWGVKARSADEKKFVDTEINTDIDTTGTVTPINLVATGTDFFNRIGRKILIKSFQVRAFLGIENVNQGSGVRYMLVYDKQTNGALPAVGDILGIPTTSNPFTAMLNLNNRDRFVILWDKIYRMDLGSGIITVLKKYKKLSHETVYSGTTAAIGSIATGGLYLLQIGSVASGMTDVDQTAVVRIRFTDA